MLTTFFFSTVCLCFRQCFKSELSFKPGERSLYWQVIQKPMLQNWDPLLVHCREVDGSQWQTITFEIRFEDFSFGLFQLVLTYFRLKLRLKILVSDSSSLSSMRHSQHWFAIFRQQYSLLSQAGQRISNIFGVPLLTRKNTLAKNG